jgi:hypothetical protein
MPIEGELRKIPSAWMRWDEAVELICFSQKLDYIHEKIRGNISHLPDHSWD